MADLMTLTREFIGQVKRALANPKQRGFRMTSGRGLDERPQILNQPTIALGQSLSATSSLPNPFGIAVMIEGFDRGVQFRDPGLDGTGRKSSRCRHSCNPTPPQGHSFGGGPPSVDPFIHDRNECLELLRNGSNCNRVGHKKIVAEAL
jgi:hypothetical protein